MPPVLSKIAKAILYGTFALMIIASVPAFRESVLLGSALIALPVLYAVINMLMRAGRIKVSLAFLFIGFGLLECSLGIVKGIPVSWVLGFIYGMWLLVSAFVTAVVSAHRATFPKVRNGELPFPELLSDEAPFSTAFGDGGSGEAADSAKRTEVPGFASPEYESPFDDTPNGRGGINPHISADDPFGEFFK